MGRKSSPTSFIMVRMAWNSTPIKTRILGFFALLLAVTTLSFQLLRKKEKPGGENGITDAILERSQYKRGGFFVEMGANDGINSNSLKLETQFGWKGLCIEAGPSNFKKLQQNRPFCTNINAVVAEMEGEAIFREFPDGPLYGHSGLLDSRSENDWKLLLAGHPETVFQDHKVKTNTLAQIFRENKVPQLDYFSLDVEGAEMLILRNYPFEEYPVQMWTIESNKLDRAELESFMDSKGYQCSHHDWINTICRLS